MAERHDCSQGAEFEKIKKQQVEMLALAQATAKALEDHRTAQQLHEKELGSFMASASQTLQLVNSKLIPAYDRETNAENAKKWIREQAKSGSFWIGVLMSIIGFFWALVTIAKQALK